MDVLRRYLEAEKRKNPSQLRSKLLKDSPIQLDLEIETFLKDFSKKNSLKNFKDQTPRF